MEGGLFNFHPSGQLSLIISCESYTLSYAGPFRWNDNQIQIDVKVSNRESFIGTTIDRELAHQDGDRIDLVKVYPGANCYAYMEKAARKFSPV